MFFMNKYFWIGERSYIEFLNIGMIDVEMEGGVYMIGGIVFEMIYWYILLICVGLVVFLIIFGDVFDFDGLFDLMFIIFWLIFISLFGFFGECLMD